MDVPIETLASFWDTAWENAPQGAGSLKGQLRQYETVCSSQFQTTGTIGSVSKNSASQSYRGAALGSLTIVQAQTAWRWLIKLYYKFLEQCQCLYQNNVPWFIAEFQTAPPNLQPPQPQFSADPDYAVWTLGARWLAMDFTEYQVDLSEMRVAPTLPAYNGVPITG